MANQHDDGDLTITASGQTLGGWTDVEVIRGIEVTPWSFNISATEKVSEDSPKVIIQPGDAAQIKIGGDLVITGYVDRLRPFITGGTHGMNILGRSKSADAVDCSAEWPNSQINGSSVLEIATKLLKPYGISVKGEVDVGPPIPQFPFNVTETPYSILEPLCRFRGLLIFDDADGNMVLAQAGKDKMGSGFTQGQNIQMGQAEYAMDQRFQTYEAFIMAIDQYRDAGDGGNLQATVTDPGVKRHRLKSIIAESGDPGFVVLKKRALWEAARRAGRGNVVTILTDSWRDQNGKLWTPNATVPIDAAALKLPKGTEWVIAWVALRRNLREGTVAEVIAMPRDAFVPEPIILQPLALDVAAALSANGK